MMRIVYPSQVIEIVKIIKVVWDTKEKILAESVDGCRRDMTADEGARLKWSPASQG